MDEAVGATLEVLEKLQVQGHNSYFAEPAYAQGVVQVESLGFSEATSVCFGDLEEDRTDLNEAKRVSKLLPVEV